MSFCRNVYHGDAFLQRTLDFIDCHARTLGEQGYQGIAAAGSGFSVLLTGLLTIFVALYGYRMLLGEVPRLREGVMAFAKIGIVLALATSWPVYRVLIYDVALLGPAQVASEIGGAARIAGAGGGLVPRLAQTDDALGSLARIGIGPQQPGATVARDRTVNGMSERIVESEASPADSFDSTALGVARAVFLVSTIVALAAVRIVAGLLLALGPLFIAFLLFEGTRGLFEGWLRGLAGAAVGAVGVTIVLGIELALLEPFIANLFARRAAGLGIAGAPTELLAILLVFAGTLLAVLLATARLAMGFRLPPGWRERIREVEASALRSERTPMLAGEVQRVERYQERSRAAVVADAVAAAHRRDLRLVESAAAPAARRNDITVRQSGAIEGARYTPGQASDRRSKMRASGSSRRRDDRR